MGGLLSKSSSASKWWRAEDTLSALPQQRAFAQSGYVPEPQLKAESVRCVRAASRNPTAPEARAN
ncbi:hypothetical protein ACQKKG_14375 [Brevundimonas sp. NPDC003935]|uniref:hypothetical protein n=1 Tax=unclassified Brevundimonas TaxID=2622653 RepID=UPI003673B909